MTPMIMNWILIAIVILSMLIGLARGAMGTLLSTIVWLIAVAVAILFNVPLANWVGQLSFLQSIAPLLCAIVVLVVLLFIGLFITKIFNLVGNLTNTSGLSRLIGVVIGFVRGAICVLAVVFVVNLSSLSNSLWWQGSQLTQAMTPWVSAIQQALVSRAAALPYTKELPKQLQPQASPHKANDTNTTSQQQQRQY